MQENLTFCFFVPLAYLIISIMKKLLFLLVLLATTPLPAQKTTVEIGPELKIERDLNFWGQLHSDPTGHYVLLTEADGGLFSRRGITPTLQKYDRKFQLVYSKELRSDQTDVLFGSMLYAKEKFLLCAQWLDKKKRKLTCTATPVSLEGKVSKPQKVSVVQYKNKDDQPTDVRWMMSDDTSKMLVATAADDNNDRLRVRINLNIFDHQLAKIWGKEFLLPYTQEQLTIRSWALANNGQVYLLGKVYEEKNNQEFKRRDGKRRPAYKMVIFRFDPTLEKAQEYRLELSDKFVTDVAFKLSPNNDLNCAGFYANDTRGVIQGVFFTRLNGETGQAELATRKELSARDIDNFDTQKDRSGKEGLDSKFEFKNLLLRADGGIVVTAEEAYHVTTSYWAAGQIYYHTTYYNNEIFLTSISPTGQIEWVRMIPKRQEFTDTDFFNSYMLMEHDGGMYFLYNDDEDNIANPLTAKARRISSFRDAVAALVTVSSAGQMERRKVFDAKEDADALMAPGNGRQISANELFFVTTRFKVFGAKRLRMGLIRVL